MKSDRRARAHMLSFCGEIREDDGIDPRDYFRHNTRSRKEDRKAKQLCSQVAQTLSLALSDGGDELLGCLHVESVMPAPNASRLLVSLRAGMNAENFGLAAIESRLATHRGRLRCEVAAAITRRKAPLLIYQITGPLQREEDRT